MNFENSIRLCKMEIAEYSKNIKDEDVKWIKKKLIEHYSSELKGYDKDPEKEFSLLNLLADMLYGIMSKKPKDIKSFVKMRLKEKEYDKKLKHFADLSISLNLGDEKTCDEIEEKLSKLLKKANKEIPGFEEKRSRMISEIFADLLAVRTKGEKGSARMLSKLLPEVVKKKMEEKKDR